MLSSLQDKKNNEKEKTNDYKNSLIELDKIAKMLIKRDLALSDSKEKLVVEKGKIEAVVNSLTDGLVMINQEQRIILINPKAQNILNVEGKELIGKTLFELSEFSQIKKFYEVFLNTEGHCRDEKCELSLFQPLEKNFEIQTVTVITQSQETIGTLIVLHDITREKVINKMKSEFITIAAHQLRTPLTGIKWSLKLILDENEGKINNEQKELLNNAYQCNERMIKLVNGLLVVSHLEESSFVYKLSEIQINKLIQDVVKSFSVQIKNKNIKCIFNESNFSLPKIKVDLEKIRMVLENLIDNAIKYTTQNGEIVILLNENNNDIKVSIKDTGIGILEKDQERLFTKFFRSEEALKMETSGSGLGLFIAKSIIEAHNGKIWVESKEGIGSTFYFTLPIGT
ncbi:MAG: ATP-binding protein [Patescibacteria group bacterium]